MDMRGGVTHGVLGSDTATYQWDNERKKGPMMTNSEPNGKVHIFASQFYAHRHHVMINDHIIGVLHFDGASCRILRLKLGRDEEGRNVFREPVGDLSRYGTSYPTTNAAADACLSHWTERSAV